MSQPEYSSLSDDEFPDLTAIIAPTPLMATGDNGSLRRSPRKKPAIAYHQARSPMKREKSESSPRKRPVPSPQKAPTGKLTASSVEILANPFPPSVPAVLGLRRDFEVFHTTMSSSNGQSSTSPQQGLRLIRADAVAKHSMPANRTAKWLDPSERAEMLASRKGHYSKSKHPKHKARCSEAKQFFLREARCSDNDSSSTHEDQDEDDDTDLSGFIVDDDAELSYHDSCSSASADSDSGGDSIVEIKHVRVQPRRRLYRGSRDRNRPNTKQGSSSDKENDPVGALTMAIQKVQLDSEVSESSKPDIIDLTSSPGESSAPHFHLGSKGVAHDPVHSQHEQGLSDKSNPLQDFDRMLRLSPPYQPPSITIPSKAMPPPDPRSAGDDGDAPSGGERRDDVFITPPHTPPRSPSRLKSPSKLLSPTKGRGIPDTPHRQSMDAFWDHNVINEWNDEYSPRKGPRASPRKNPLRRFHIWSDSEDDEKSSASGDLFRSPFSSPGKPRSRAGSPSKSPEKESKARLAAERRTSAARKKAFERQKEQMAVDLLGELDVHVAGGRLGTLAADTGGVKVVWSKTLRSTAGRANWKRTVTKSSGSPVKGTERAGFGVQVQHFACIELADKIIDCEDRLVNTLAHEFCHLTNFMISNVRDQPHGKSFKEWAAKVTAHLRQSPVEAWRHVHVTTKHAYVINHKYLWVCVGRDQTPAMGFLNIGNDPGCGAEYGRHSKSIDIDKHRCGQCRGRLVQVRPKPRASPVKKDGGGGRMRLSREPSTETESSGSLLSNDTASCADLSDEMKNCNA